MDGRDRLLARLRAMDNVAELPEPYVRQAPADAAQFEAAFTRAGGEILEAEALAEFAGWPAILDADATQAWPSTVPLTPAEVWDARVGVTQALALVAETGSIWLAAGPDTFRLVSLAPEVHVVLASHAQLVGTLEDAVAVEAGRTGVLITGPSRTADIEGILVRGIHGPKRLILVWNPPHFTNGA